MLAGVLLIALSIVPSIVCVFAVRVMCVAYPSFIMLISFFRVCNCSNNWCVIGTKSWLCMFVAMASRCILACIKLVLIMPTFSAIALICCCLGSGAVMV